MANEAEFILWLKSVFDNKGTKDAVAAMQEVSKESEKTSKSSSDTAKSFDSMYESSKLLTKTGLSLITFGTSLATAMTFSAKNYVNQVGMADSTSRQWLKTTFEIKESYIGIGRVAAQAVLPYMQKASELAKGVSDYTQKHPEIAKVGMGVAAGSIAIGAISTVVGQLQSIMKLFGGTSLLSLFGKGATAATSTGGSGLATTTAATAAGGAGLSAAGVIASILAGVGLGLKGNDLLNKTQDPRWHSGVESNQAITVLAYEIGLLAEKLGAKSGTALSWAKGTGEATGAIQSGATATSGTQPGGEYVTTNMLQSMLNYQRQSKYAQQDYYRSLYTTQRDYQLQMQYAYEDYQIQTSRSQRDFQLQQAYSAQQFYYQQAIAQRNYFIQVSRNEYDYQLSRKRAAEDHNWSLKQIMLSGDALQYYYSQRQYDIDKRRAEEDYQLQKKRNAEDFALQQQDAATQFAMERAYAKQQFAIQMADAAQNFAIQRKRQQEQYEIQLADMEYQYELEKKRRWEAFQQEIVPELGDEANTRLWIERQLETAMVTQFNSLMSSMVNDWQGYSPQQDINSTNKLLGNSAYPSYYDKGGYTKAGPAIVHNGEFVMNAKTTAAAEAAAQGSLTQEKMIDLFTNGGKSFVYEDKRSFNRGLTAEEKIGIRNDTQKILIDALGY